MEEPEDTIHVVVCCKAPADDVGNAICALTTPDLVADLSFRNEGKYEDAERQLVLSMRTTAIESDVMTILHQREIKVECSVPWQLAPQWARTALERPIELPEAVHLRYALLAKSAGLANV